MLRGSVKGGGEEGTGEEQGEAIERREETGTSSTEAHVGMMPVPDHYCTSCLMKSFFNHPTE